MCYFVTATIPDSSSVGQLNKLAEKHGLKFSAIHNSFVENQLPNALIYLEKDSTNCDCDTVLGSLNRYNSETLDYKAQIDKLKRKGWTQVKIKRWLSEKKGAQDKLERERLDQKDHWYQKAADWLEFLQAVTSEREIGRFGILLHFYRSNSETEKVHLKSVKIVSLKEIDASYLMEIDEDTLYQFEQ